MVVAEADGAEAEAEAEAGALGLAAFFMSSSSDKLEGPLFLLPPPVALADSAELGVGPAAAALAEVELLAFAWVFELALEAEAFAFGAGSDAFAEEEVPDLVAVVLSGRDVDLDSGLLAASACEEADVCGLPVLAFPAAAAAAAPAFFFGSEAVGFTDGVGFAAGVGVLPSTRQWAPTIKKRSSTNHATTERRIAEQGSGRPNA